MGEGLEVEMLRDDVTEIKGDVKEIHKSLSDLRVLIAGGYVTKKEFEEYKRDELAGKRQLAAGVVAIAGIVATFVSALMGKG